MIPRDPKTAVSHRPRGDMITVILLDTVIVITIIVIVFVTIVVSVIICVI